MKNKKNKKKYTRTNSKNKKKTRVKYTKKFKKKSINKKLRRTSKKLLKQKAGMLGELKDQVGMMLFKNKNKVPAVTKSQHEIKESFHETHFPEVEVRGEKMFDVYLLDRALENLKKKKILVTRLMKKDNLY